MSRKTIIANDNILQTEDKENYAAALINANKELALQIVEREKRAAELLIANKELAYQNTEKEKRAAELVIANKELELQVIEKEKRAAELVIANKELAYQNQEKENRAAELIIANKELAFQNEEKEKRAIELLTANKELETFTFISSHHLQEPLRKIQSFSGRILDDEYDNLSDNGKYYFERTMGSALHMQTLINDLIAYSRTSLAERKFIKSDLNSIVSEVILELKDELKDVKIKVKKLHQVNIIQFQFRQLLQNLIRNSLKFTKPEVKPQITIKSQFIKYNPSTNSEFFLKKDHYHISVVDNGIGFAPDYNFKIFEIFQRLHQSSDYDGTGIGLTVARKIVENHHGIITANGKLNQGATFDIYIPSEQE